jgi:ABC-type uncharacterized transport system auxiliary subunit
MKMSGCLFMMICLFFLAGCMPFASQPAPTLYTLHAAPVRQKTGRIVHVISVPEPEVPAGFDSSRIALYLYNGRRLDYYAKAAWPEHLGKVLQDVIGQSASSVPGMMGVIPDEGLAASYNLLVKVNDFEAVYAAGPDNPPRLKVSMNFRLISPRSQKTALNITLSLESIAIANTQTAVISGLESLLREINARAFKKISLVL